MSSPAPAPPSRWRFGPFEVDVATSELRRNGLRLRLPDQPARILEALLARPGELVTRDELRERLWPADTFVDFERSLNAAVAKLRQVLSDSAERPRYVETVARRGYRFVAPVESCPPAPQTAVPSEATPPVAAPSRNVKHVWVAALAAGFGLVVAGAFLLGTRGLPDDPPPVRFVVHPPEAARIHPMSAISPDGTKLAFVVVDRAGRRKLWLRALAMESAIALADTDDASLPFFSPDAKNIAFFADGKLKTIPISGGPPQTLCEARQPGGGAWSRDNVILFSQSGRLYRVSAAGGAAADVARPATASGERDIDTWPQFLPDGRRFIVSTATHNGHVNAIRGEILLGSLDSPKRIRLVAARGRAAVTTSGHLLFIRNYTLLAQALDISAARLKGEPMAVARDLNRSSANVQVDIADGLPVGVAPAPFTVSDNGVLAYHASPPPLKRLVWFNRQGERLSTIGELRDYMQIFLSPDENWAALAIRTDAANWSLWLLNLKTNALSRLTFGNDKDPAWGPRSDTLVYGAQQPGGGQVDLMEIKLGDRAAKLLYADGNSNKPESWTPDGGLLLFRRNEQKVFALPVSGERKPAPLLQTPFIRHSFRFSPDGKWVAYTSSESGSAEIYVCRFPEMTGVRQVSTTGGAAPVWRSDGRELFYMTMLGEMMVVDVNAGSAQFSAPKPLFKPETKTPGIPQFGVAENGRKFLVIEENPARSTEDRLVVQTRWGAVAGR